MGGYERVVVDIEGTVATVTLNRPERRNAADLEMSGELLDALRMLSDAERVRVICLTGAGAGFCAGADLRILGTEGPALVQAGKALVLAIREAPKPVLAAVNGAAAGGGANLALACDYRIASDTASIGQVFHRLGLAPDWGGSFFLPRLVGPSRALELIWSARMVPAQEALALGLFDRVVPADRLMLEARALADQWAAFPPAAVRRAKAAVYGSEGHALAEALEIEIVHQNELFATPEARDRIEGANPMKRGSR